MGGCRARPDAVYRGTHAQRLGEERLAVHNAALAGQLPEHPVARVKDVDDSETVPEPATFLGVLIESFAPEAVSDKLAAVPDVT